MRIKELVVTEKSINIISNSSFVFPFGEKTLISSSDNTVGKTSLIRFLLHSLGYKVPSTHGLKMNQYVTVLFFAKGNNEYSIERNGNKCTVYNSDHSIKKEYNVSNTEERNGLHSFIFDVDNPTVIENLLGCFYIDQDNGWKVAAKGKVIDSNKFSCASLVSGFLNSDEIMSLDNSISQLAGEIQKYQSIKKTLSLGEELLDYDNVEDKLDNDVETTLKSQQVLQLKINELQSQISQYEKIINDNNKIVELIDNLKLVIKLPNNTQMLLSKDALLDFDENQSIVEMQLAEAKMRLGDLKKKITISRQTEGFKELKAIETLSKKAYNAVLSSGIKPSQLDNMISHSKKELLSLREQLKKLLSIDSQYAPLLINSITDELKRFSENRDLQIKDVLTMSVGSRFSGIELHDICFAYTIGTYRFIKSQGIEIPLIIDSPGSGERVPSDLAELIKYITNDIQGSQIVISTACRINDVSTFDKKITAKGKIFEGEYKVS